MNMTGKGETSFEAYLMDNGYLKYDSLLKLSTGNHIVSTMGNSGYYYVHNSELDFHNSKQELRKFNQVKNTQIIYYGMSMVRHGHGATLSLGCKPFFKAIGCDMSYDSQLDDNTMDRIFNDFSSEEILYAINNRNKVRFEFDFKDVNIPIKMNVAYLYD